MKNVFFGSLFSVGIAIGFALGYLSGEERGKATTYDECTKVLEQLDELIKSKILKEES